MERKWKYGEAEHPVRRIPGTRSPEWWPEIGRWVIPNVTPVPQLQVTTKQEPVRNRRNAKNRTARTLLPRAVPGLSTVARNVRSTAGGSGVRGVSPRVRKPRP